MKYLKIFFPLISLFFLGCKQRELTSDDFITVPVVPCAQAGEVTSIESVSGKAGLGLCYRDSKGNLIEVE
tara:strand:+ start:115 stop:324 length:210 start_codon:yes stop_codon:yes gene_type:complete